MTTYEQAMELSRERALMALSHIEAWLDKDPRQITATAPENPDAARLYSDLYARMLADVLGAFGDAGRQHLRTNRSHILGLPQHRPEEQ